MLEMETTELPREDPTTWSWPTESNSEDPRNGGGGGGGGDDGFDTQNLIIVVGIIGIVSNGFSMLVICGYPKLRKKRGSILIINQTAIDLATSFFLATYYIAQVSLGGDASLKGAAGELYCRLWDSGVCHWSLMMSSTYNLVAITTERYVMVVHPLFHKKTFTREALYVISLVVWLTGILYVGVWSVGFSSSVDGMCKTYHANLSPASKEANGILSFLIGFLLPVLMMVFMYSRMVLVLTLRRRTNLVGASNAASNAKNHVSKTHKNLIKTFLIVVSLFFFCWVANKVTWFLYNIGVELKVKTDYHFGTVMCVYINCCINPFVYIFKYQDFQKGMEHLFPCRIRRVGPMTSSDAHSVTETGYSVKGTSGSGVNATESEA